MNKGKMNNQSEEYQKLAEKTVQMGSVPRIEIDEMDPVVEGLEGETKEKVVALMADRKRCKRELEEMVRTTNILRQAMERKRQQAREAQREIKELEARLEVSRMMNQLDNRYIEGMSAKLQKKTEELDKLQNEKLTMSKQGAPRMNEMGEYYRHLYEENIRANTIVQEALGKKKSEVKELKAKLEIARTITEKDEKTIKELRQQINFEQEKQMRGAINAKSTEMVTDD